MTATVRKPALALFLAIGYKSFAEMLKAQSEAARKAVMPDLVQQTMARASMVWVISCTAAISASGVVFSGTPRWLSI